MKTDGQVYADCMEELKSRLVVVQKFIKSNVSTGSDTTDIEFLCLQFRKCIELVAMGSIASHKEGYEKVRKNFQRDWKVELIFKDIERLNESFYPVPIVMERSSQKGVDYHFERLESGYLSREKCIEVYKKCGSLLHAENPYGRNPKIKDVTKEFSQWIEEIIRLLDTHCIVFPGNNNLWIVQMHPQPSRKVHVFKAEGHN